MFKFGTSKRDGCREAIFSSIAVILFSNAVCLQRHEYYNVEQEVCTHSFDPLLHLSASLVERIANFLLSI